MDDIACATCGASFTPHQRNQRYCSAYCHRHRGWRRTPKPCATDGCPRLSHDGKALCQMHRQRAKKGVLGAAECAADGCDHLARFDDGLCQLHHPRKPRISSRQERICPQCGEAFTTTGRKWRYVHCPPPLTSRGTPTRSAGYLPMPVVDFTCEVCGNLQVGRRGKRFCDRECYRKWHHRSRLARNARKARKMMERATRVDRRAIYERDAWTCWLCGRLARQDVHYNHPLAPTIDHVVPVADGGKHEPGNLLLAHRVCNVRRGTMIVWTAKSAPILDHYLPTPTGA